jgi:hypothetical protein
MPTSARALITCEPSRMIKTSDPSLGRTSVHSSEVFNTLPSLVDQSPCSSHGQTPSTGPRSGASATSPLLRVVRRFMTNGAGTCKFSSGSLGDVESFDNLRRREPHDQLARYAVAPAIFIGSVFTHVARSDAGRNCQELFFIFTGRRDALYLYE